MTDNSHQRFITLDVFRGLTVFFMIVVNTQGSGAVPFTQLTHASWNGCTLTDLVFPSFLFAVGNAMVFANKKLVLLPERAALYRIFRRTFLLFLIGYLLSWYPFVGWNGEGAIWLKPLGETRIMAVLQRIGLAYCFASLLVRYIPSRYLILVSAILLITYWGLLHYFGYQGIPYTIEGNAVRRLDLLVLGAPHMYKENGIVFDPEGILSTLPAIVNVLAGYLTGCFMLRKGKTIACIVRLLLTGTALVLIAIYWDRFFPINKKLWSSSYVLYTSGIDILFVGVLYYFIEIRQWKRGTYFFIVFGKNPLFIYILSNLLGVFLILYLPGNITVIDWLNTKIFQVIAPGPVGCLLFSLFFTMLCWLAGWIMDKKKVYIRL